MRVIVWAARRVQDLIEVVVSIIAAVVTPIGAGIAWLFGLVGYGLVLALAIGLPIGALYLLVRFIKWAWAD